MKRFSCLMIFTAFVFLPLFVTGQTADEYAIMAKKSIAVMDYSTALKMINKGLEADPGNMDLHVMRGEVLLEMERYDKAREDFDVVLRNDSNVVGASLGLSGYYRFTNKPDSAIYYALKGIRISPDNFHKSRSKIFLAEAYREYGQDSLAMIYLKAGLSDDSTNVSGYKNAADISMKNGDFEGAYVYLQMANFYLMEDMENLINLAYVANMLEYNREALEYCNQALNLDSHHPLALSNRANAYLQLNQLALAEKDIQKSLSNDKSNPMAHRYAGEICLAQGKQDKACKHFRDANKLGYSRLYDNYIDEQMNASCK